jgi:hypothetical protein
VTGKTLGNDRITKQLGKGIWMLAEEFWGAGLADQAEAELAHYLKNP